MDSVSHQARDALTADCDKTAQTRVTKCSRIALHLIPTKMVPNVLVCCFNSPVSSTSTMTDDGNVEF